MPDPFFTPAEIVMVREAHQKLTDDEFKVAIHVAEKRRFMPAPLGNHIYFQKRKSRGQDAAGNWIDLWKMTVETSIDGLRLGAERSGKYLGQSEARYETDNYGPVSATVIVYKLGPNGQTLQFPGQARFTEYAQYTGFGEKRRLNNMWAEKPYLMLAKCAEALALRKAFPDELSGLYTPDEMGSADAEEKAQDDVVKTVARADAKIEEQKQQKKISGMTIEDCKAGRHTFTTHGDEMICERCGVIEQVNSGPQKPAQTTSAAASPQGTAAPAAGNSASSAGPSSAPAAAPPSSDLVPKERIDMLIAALRNAVEHYQVPSSTLIALLRAWAPRNGVPIVSDSCMFAKDVTVDEFRAMAKGYNAWEKTILKDIRPATQQPAERDGTAAASRRAGSQERAREKTVQTIEQEAEDAQQAWEAAQEAASSESLPG